MSQIFRRFYLKWVAFKAGLIYRSSPLGLLMLLTACGGVPVSPNAGVTTLAPDRISLTKMNFSDLAGWQSDQIQETLSPLRKSCPSLSRTVTATQGPQFWSAGESLDWQPICNALRNVTDNSPESARKFFEQWFTPYQASGKNGSYGLFTGYFEMEIEGVRRPDSKFSTPLYTVPADLVTIDLGLFRPDLKGRKLSGQMMGKEMRPYYSRSDIEKGALAGRNLELVYVTPIDAFFLAVQGSGRVMIQDSSERTDKKTEKNNEKKMMRVGYAGTNGQIYQSIGNELIKRGIMETREVTASAIRQWLNNHVEQAAIVMNTNPSYVFFRELPGNDDGPIGASNLPLTPLRSLAVDSNFCAHGGTDLA